MYAGNADPSVAGSAASASCSMARFPYSAVSASVGALALPFPDVPPLPTGFSYYVVAPRERLRLEPVAKFRSWVIEEARSLRNLTS